MPRPRIFALSLCIFVYLPGCGGDGPRADAGPGPAVELGTGTINWESVDAEQELVLIAGTQGAHHFVLHARTLGILPGDPERPGIEDNPTTSFQIFDEAGFQVDAQFPPYKLGYRSAGDGWFVLPSGRVMQFIEAEVDRLFGERVRIVLRVRDDLGHEASDERWVIATREPDAADAGTDSDAQPAR